MTSAFDAIMSESESHVFNNPSSSSSLTITDTVTQEQDSPTPRLWIGNLDLKLTDGPSAGMPRGYAFVTYKDASSAHKCIRELDSKRLLDRIVSVRWANQAPSVIQDEEEKIRSKIPALGIKPSEKPISKTKAISAIEAKLRAMEKDQPNFSLSSSSIQSSTSKLKQNQSLKRAKPYDKNVSKPSSQISRNR